MKKQGFTLIEMVVALGIFGFIIVIYVGLYGRFVIAQRQGVQIQAVLEQVRVAFEVMDREIRTGFGSTYVVSDVLGRGVLFRNQSGNCVHYRWEAEAIQRAEIEQGGSECTPGDFSGAAYTRMTGSGVSIPYMRFDAVVANQIGTRLQNQGFITIVAGVAAPDSTIPPVTFQSSITSRQVAPYAE